MLEKLIWIIEKLYISEIEYLWLRRLKKFQNFYLDIKSAMIKIQVHKEMKQETPLLWLQGCYAFNMHPFEGLTSQGIFLHYN